MGLNGFELKPRNSPAFRPLHHRAAKQTPCWPTKAIFFLAVGEWGEFQFQERMRGAIR